MCSSSWQQTTPHAEEPCAARRLEAWATTPCLDPTFRDARLAPSSGVRSVPEIGGALLQVGGDRLELVGRADQLLLLDRFGRQPRFGIRCDGKIEQPLGGADRIRALGGDLLRGLERRGARIVDQAGDEAELLRLLAVEDAAGVGELA